MVKKHAVLRRASNVALESNAQKKPTSATEFVKYSKSVIEFQVRTKYACDCLSRMLTVFICY